MAAKPTKTSISPSHTHQLIALCIWMLLRMKMNDADFGATADAQLTPTESE
jgi:hypothetical protein